MSPYITSNEIVKKTLAIWLDFITLFRGENGEMMAKSIRDIVNKDGRKVTRSQYVPLNRQVEKKRN